MLGSEYGSMAMPGFTHWSGLFGGTGLQRSSHSCPTLDVLNCLVGMGIIDGYASGEKPNWALLLFFLGGGVRESVWLAASNSISSFIELITNFGKATYSGWFSSFECTLFSQV